MDLQLTQHTSSWMQHRQAAKAGPTSGWQVEEREMQLLQERAGCVHVWPGLRCWESQRLLWLAAPRPAACMGRWR